jgi:hypothetical protein
MNCVNKCIPGKIRTEYNKQYRINNKEKEQGNEIYKKQNKEKIK